MQKVLSLKSSKKKSKLWLKLILGLQKCGTIWEASNDQKTYR